MKNWAVQRTDYVGAVYTVGYVIAANEDDARVKAKSVHRDAWVVPAESSDDHVAIDELLTAMNHETHRRLQGVR